MTWFLLSYIPYAFPVFELPAPTGIYNVGTRDWTFTDSSRLEVYTAQPEDYRRFAVKVWYPVIGESSDQYSTNIYMPNARIESAALGNHSGLPSFLLSHLRLIKTHSKVDVPLIQGYAPFPVILFSHGHAFYASPSQNAALMEELASHGYVAIALNHTYESMSTEFPESDEIVLLDSKLVKEIQRSIVRGLPRDSIVNFLVSVQDSVQMHVAFSQLMEFNGLFARSVATWKGDVEYIVNQVLDNPPDEEFRGRLDKNRVGIVGMSLGGANATVSCSEIPSIKAGINMDGFVYGDAFSNGVSQPFTFMYSEQNDEMNRFMYRRMMNDTYRVKIVSSSHTDFSEFSFLSRIGFEGIDPNHCHKIINNYCVNFFNKYLNDQVEIDLNSVVGQYEDVEFEKIAQP